MIEREIERNSRMIDKITGDKFYPITLTASRVNFMMGKNSEGLYMTEDAKRIYFAGTILTLTSITQNGVALVKDVDYIQGSNFIVANNSRFTVDQTAGVLITGTCGYTTTPDVINEICLAMTEVTTGLGTYTMIDSAGDKTQITRDNMPDWVEERLALNRTYYDYG